MSVAENISSEEPRMRAVLERQKQAHIREGAASAERFGHVLLARLAGVVRESDAGGGSGVGEGDGLGSLGEGGCCEEQQKQSAGPSSLRSSG